MYTAFSSLDDHSKISLFTNSHTIIQWIYVQHFLYEKGQFGVQYLA